MNKTVFLLVSGESDYSALDFERNYNAQKVYQEMAEEGVAQKVYETDDYYINIKIKVFNSVDPDFITFVLNELCDYDQLKDKNIYQVK